MKLVRIDGIAPGGRPLDLHPRLTVVRGSGPELRRRLESVLRAIADGSEPELGGVIEVSGVQLALDHSTLQQLALDMEIDPVLVLSDGAPQRPVVPPVDLPPGAPVEHASEAPRARLQQVSARRIELGSQLEAARARLDPFATTALETCIGQIEALERRRTTLRAEWEDERRQHAAARQDLETSVEALRADLTMAVGIDPAPVLSARAALVASTDVPAEVDPEAATLADQLDATLERMRDLQSRRSQVEIRTSEAEQRLSEARHEASRAADSMRSPDVDREAVRRLEAVRDEIFEVDDRHGRLAAGRNKRKLQELRAEQAILLEQLGYDTYSAYVMGIPSTRAELERSARLESAQDRVDRIAEEIERLRSEAPRVDEVDRVEAELQTLLVRAQRHVGPNEELSVPLDVGAPSSPDLIYEIIAALRRRRLSSPGEDDPAVRGTLSELRRCLDLSQWTPREGEHPAPPEPPELAPLDGLDRSELLDRSDQWLGWHRELRAWIDRATDELVELEGRLGTFEPGRPGRPDQPHQPDQAVSRWAEVETELDAALDRLADAEERVRVHESATAEVAELRTTELDLRDQERALLRQVADAEAAPSHAAAPSPTPPPYRPDTTATPSAPVASADSEREWAVVSRAARQRRVSFVGSLPMLVVDLDGTAGAPVCRRLQRLSELVQMVVVTDEPQMVDQLVGQSTGARLVDLSAPVP